MGSPKIGVFNYSQAQEANILNGLSYVNIHSVNFPNGEIRGQIAGSTTSCPTPTPTPTATATATPTATATRHGYGYANSYRHRDYRTDTNADPLPRDNTVAHTDRYGDGHRCTQPDASCAGP